MPRTSIDQRIRSAVKKKATVRITSRMRSNGGFWVIYPGPDGKPERKQADSKREALNMLLVKARCCESRRFEIVPREPGEQ